MKKNKKKLISRKKLRKKLHRKTILITLILCIVFYAFTYGFILLIAFFFKNLAFYSIFSILIVLLWDTFLDSIFLFDYDAIKKNKIYKLTYKKYQNLRFSKFLFSILNISYIVVEKFKKDVIKWADNTHIFGMFQQSMVLAIAVVLLFALILLLLTILSKFFVKNEKWFIETDYKE